MKKNMVKLKIPTTPYIPHDSLFDFCCLLFLRYYILPGLADQNRKNLYFYFYASHAHVRKMGSVALLCF